MKVLLTGASGLLGHDLWKLFEKKHELLAVGRTRGTWIAPELFRECDLTNAAHTYALITKENPEIVIHCAAYNNVDAAETDPTPAFKTNATATRNVALACQRFDTTLLSVSTDYVFGAEPGPPTGFREFDTCHPINQYGRSKRWGEEFVQQLLSRYFIVRTSWLFGPARVTWVDRVAQAALNRERVPAAIDMVSAPTYTPDLAAAIARLAESRHYGIYHLTNSGFCSRVELAEEVVRLHKGDASAVIDRKNLSELRLPAPRPPFSGLDNFAWRLDGFPPMRSWKDALREHFARRKVTAS